MASQSPAVLERLLRDNGLGWMIDMFGPPGGAIPHLLEQLNRVAAQYHARFGIELPFSPGVLDAEARDNPHKVRAFLEALAISPTADMLVMVWRILQGLGIRKVSMEYCEQELFSLVVTLARPGDDPVHLEEYRSSDINDAALVHHFGITTINGHPLFDGFFPMRHK